MLTPQEQVVQAVHTALAELPRYTASEDVADCVCGMIGLELYEQFEQYITDMIWRLNDK